MFTPQKTIYLLVSGLYFYALNQLIFLTRFGRLNTSFEPLDIGLILIGIGSIFMLAWLLQKFPHQPRPKVILSILFVVAIVLAIPFSLGGGLIFGILGLTIMGLLPFAILLGGGYWFLKGSAEQ